MRRSLFHTAVLTGSAGEAAHVIDVLLYHEADLDLAVHHADGGRIYEELIEAHWDDVLPLAASVRAGTVSASLMLKRLGAYSRQNGLALALREIGRIERTLSTLEWLEDPLLQHQDLEHHERLQERLAALGAIRSLQKFGERFSENLPRSHRIELCPRVARFAQPNISLIDIPEPNLSPHRPYPPKSQRRVRIKIRLRLRGFSMSISTPKIVLAA